MDKKTVRNLYITYGARRERERSCSSQKIKQFFLCHVYDKNFQRSKNKRTLILRWASYLDAFNSYPLCT
jgi:hypothetical protein